MQTYHSQNQVFNKIVDSENGTLVTNVSIYLTNSDSTFVSTNGIFKAPISGAYTFSKKGYLTKSVTIKVGISHTVALKKVPLQLNEVVINSNHIPTTINTSTSSNNLITTQAIERGNSTNINEALNRVPGIFMQSGALNTNRITIRGVGSRNLFGTSKIRAYYKDIPLTNGSGETSLEDFELGAISKIEITKGATSSVYGAGLGGVIQLLPKMATPNGTTSKNEITMGSFGLFKNLSQIGYDNERNNLNAVYSITNSDGYRDNNSYKRHSITLNSSHNINIKNELSVFGTFSDLKAFIPSSLNENDYRNSPTLAAFTWGTSRGFEDSKRGILGVSFQHEFNNKVTQKTGVFSSYRNTYEPRPFNILDENSWGFGFRHRYSGNIKLWDKLFKWTSGIEFFKDVYQYKTFENLYQDIPDANGSVKGEPLSHFKEKRQYYNIFGEGRYQFSPKTIIVLGINFNRTSYDLEDRFMTSDTNPDDSGNFKFKGICSPKLGILYHVNSTSNIYTNISHGFSPLSLQEVLLPNGQINNDLNPETGWNFEIGIKGTALKNKLQYNMSLYRLSIQNLLVARRTSEDEFIGVNAGKTHNDGIELNANYKLFHTKSIQTSIFTSYSLHLYKFKDFVDGDNNFSGNKLTGVPSNILNIGADVSTNIGIYGNLNYQYVGSMPITDSNSLFSESYKLLNVKLGYSKPLNQNLNINSFIGINNIFNETYASQILINASGFGGNAPRYYYPGNPINYYTAIALNYVF
ncbi:TonB-dependent receptor [Flavobacteriaceae bacterium MHTCC 0001]